MDGNKQVKDMTGQQFGLLTVIGRDGTYRNTRQAAWKCQCQCGNSVTICGNSLRRGLSQSCGCKKGSLPVHGMTGTRVHNVWMQMLSRCRNANNTAYRYYGARGISVCKRWEDFENFLSDMGEPDPGMMLERIDNSKGYSPSNCKWATKIEQANNTRTNVFLETPLGRMTIAQLARTIGMTRHGVEYRIRVGMTGDRLVAKSLFAKRKSTI